jgi:glucose-6-phosphate-specific signal transduction histidine kinase
MKAAIGRVEEVNKELWVLLSLFTICLILNLAVDAQRMVLSFYTLPTLGSAYYYGRRHATLTALGSVLLVVLMTWYNPVLFAASSSAVVFGSTRWLDITVWGGVLIVTG